MKRKLFKGMTGFNSTIRIGCAAAICMMPGYTLAGTTEPVAESPAEPEVASNWVDFTVGGAFIGGDEGAYKRRIQNDDFYGGISDLHWETDANDITWTLDGHALFGTENYEIILGAEKADLGYIEAGFRQFRTWYDGHGGYLPGATPEWYAADDDELHLDRGELWVEAGLRMEDMPEITFRYSHIWRDGEKDSTSWDRPIRPGIAPSLWNLDEQRDVFELDVAHTVGNTDLGLGLRYEVTENDNHRIMDDTTQTDAYDADLFNAHVYSVSRLNDKMMLSFAYSFTTMDTDTDGSSRITTPLGGHDWFDSVGGGNFKSHVANANFWWNPIEDLVIVPSIRAEREYQGGELEFTEIPRVVPGRDFSNPIYWELLGEASDSDYDSLTEQIDIRYSGIPNLMLYAKILANQTDGETKYWAYEHHELVGTRDKDLDSNYEKYVVGTTWYALKNLSFAAEYYRKNFDTDYDNDLDGLRSHIDSHDITTDDFNIRMTWRPASNLTLVTRYDWQNATYDTKGIFNSDTVLPEIESGETKLNIISQGLTYLPTQNLYLTGSVSYIWSDTETAASRAVDGLARSDNDYLTAGLTVGYALDERTDITVGYTYYYSENFVVPPGGAVGYGTDLEEHAFQVGLNRQINRNMIWNLGYGYYNSNDGTSGGNNDFDAHMVSTGLQIRF